MGEGIWVALIIAVSAAASAVASSAVPLLLARQTFRRQDQVAAQAAQAAELLEANNQIVAAAARDTHGQLREIHTLVNSNMTAAMQNELNAVKERIVTVLENIDLKEAAGRDATQERALITAMELQVRELQATLTDRLHATDTAAAQKAEPQP
jgi:hypothetical protein